MLMLATGVIPPRRCGQDCEDKTVRLMRGCDDETSEFPFEIARDDGTVEVCFRCPYALLQQREAMGTWQMLEAFEHYEAGHLAYGPGWKHQPRKMMDAIAFIRRNIGRYRKMAEEE